MPDDKKIQKSLYGLLLDLKIEGEILMIGLDGMNGGHKQLEREAGMRIVSGVLFKLLIERRYNKPLLLILLESFYTEEFNFQRIELLRRLDEDEGMPTARQIIECIRDTDGGGHLDHQTHEWLIKIRKIYTGGCRTDQLSLYKIAIRVPYLIDELVTIYEKRFQHSIGNLL